MENDRGIENRHVDEALHELVLDWCGLVLMAPDADYVVRRGPWCRTADGGGEEA